MSGQYKHWCFTWNNYTDQSLQVIRDHFEAGTFLYVCYGKEVGEEGTPHLQGVVCLETKLRRGGVRTLFQNNHVSPCRDLAASVIYCQKEGDFTIFGLIPSTGKRHELDRFISAVKGGQFDLKQLRLDHASCFAKYNRWCIDVIADHSPERVVDTHELRPWQSHLLDLLALPADDRTIIFVVDRIGNSGKSWFTHWYEQTHEHVQVMQPGKKADMAYVLNCRTKVLFVDTPRSKQGEYIQYDFLEDVKNGYVFSTKYESRVKTLYRCHVVVTMNETPDMTKLSEDRYVIIDVEDY